MKFCFFGNVAGALKGKTEGGAELQIALLARALAIKGHEVVIVDPYSAESFITADGVKLINIPDWNKGLMGLRLFKNRIPALMKIFLEQNADYYYVRMRSYLNIFPFLASRKTNNKFIIATAHDLDVLPFYKKFKYEYKPKFNLFKFFTLYLPNDLVFNHLLKNSDYVLVQHKGQKELLKSIHGKVIVFPNIFDFGVLPKVINSRRDFFIYPGALNVLKGSENLKQLVNILDKKVSIVIVGQPTDNKTEEIYKEFKKVSNIILTGRLSHRETIEMIANSRALINTSNFEGFPNIFLEAWATGVPVISLKVNPGNVFNEYHLGIYCNEDLNEMKNKIESGESDLICRKNLISYVSDHHDFTTAAERFLKNINNN